MAWTEYLHNYMREQERADSWRDFGDRFMQLAREEQGRADVVTNGEALRNIDQVLRALCDYSKHPAGWERGKPEQGMICLLETPPHGLWNYDSDGVSENLRERIRLCVAEAGRAFSDYPKGADPEDFWLHRLYLDLLENGSDLLLAAHKEGGIIVSVCVASATFCLRLARQALEQSEPGTGVERLRTGANQAESSLTPNENLRHAILNKKACIAETERTLNRPPANEHRGRAVHGGESWRLRLEEEKQHLLSALGELEAELERSSASPAQNSDKKAQSPADDSKMRIGQNIEKLRKESGWSYDQLSDATGIDKKAILAHAHGQSKPRPNTLREYAQAFSKQLSKTITANNLEE